MLDGIAANAPIKLYKVSLLIQAQDGIRLVGGKTMICQHVTPLSDSVVGALRHVFERLNSHVCSLSDSSYAYHISINYWLKQQENVSKRIAKRAGIGI